jgi:transposase InsO family protein
MLKRQGIKLNRKKLYRLYKEERLTVRKRGGRKRALGTRAPMAIPQGRNLRWSLDFVADTLVSGRRFRILTLVDDFTRECLGLVVDTSLTGLRVARELNRIAELRGYPRHACQRQRHRADLKCHLGLATGARRRLALHRAWQTDAEWLRRKLQRPPAR